MQIPDFEPLLRGEQEPYWVIGGQIIDIKLDGSRTNGAFLLLEVTTEPGGGAPLHTHSREDETLVQLEGEVTVTVGEESLVVHAGDVVFFPRGIPHSFVNSGSRPSRGIGIVTPAGAEEFFRELGVPKTGDSKPADYQEATQEAFETATVRAGMELHRA